MASVLHGMSRCVITGHPFELSTDGRHNAAWEAAIGSGNGFVSPKTREPFNTVNIRILA